MYLISILIVAVSVLGLLSGFFVLIGSEKASKPFAAFFAFFALFYALWAMSLLNDSLSMTSLNVSVIFFIATLLITIWSFVSMQSDKVTRAHKGWRLLAISLLLLADISAPVYYILTLNGYNTSWVAPLIFSPIFIITFYTVIRYRILQVLNRVCKIWAYLILSVTSIALYMSLFSLVADKLFHIDMTIEAMALNLLMIIIVTALLPIWSELNNIIGSLLSSTKVNFNYIIKVLNRYATQDIKLEKLAGFLADHLHFRYIGLIVNDEVYGTKVIDFSAEEIESIMLLDTAERSLWMEFSGHAKKTLEKHQIVAVAELRDAKGRRFGQMMIGRPVGKTSFEKRDLRSIEMIVNLVASIIDSKERVD